MCHGTRCHVSRHTVLECFFSRGITTLFGSSAAFFHGTDPALFFGQLANLAKTTEGDLSYEAASQASDGRRKRARLNRVRLNPRSRGSGHLGCRDPNQYRGVHHRDLYERQHYRRRLHFRLLPVMPGYYITESEIKKYRTERGGQDCPPLSVPPTQKHKVDIRIRRK